MTSRVEELEALKADYDALKERVATLETRPAAPAEPAADCAVEPQPHRRSGGDWGGWLGGILIAVLLPILALLVAHWLVVMVLDLKVWVIRLLSLLLPLPFAAMAPFRSRHRLGVQVILGVFIAALSVLGMLSITGLMDQQPILPQDGREWREVIEYGISIWLSYLTGALVVHFLAPLKSEKAADGLVRRLAGAMAKLTSPENENRQQLEKRIQTLAGTIGTIVPVVTGAASIISGMRKLWE